MAAARDAMNLYSELPCKIKHGQYEEYVSSAFLLNMLGFALPGTPTEIKNEQRREKIREVMQEHGWVSARRTYFMGTECGQEHHFHKLHGTRVIDYDDKGKKISIIESDAQGCLRAVTPYQDDKIHGVECRYNSSGTISERARYEHGEREGESEDWQTIDGVPWIEARTNWSQGWPQGLHECWYSNGVLSMRGYRVDAPAPIYYQSRPQYDGILEKYAPNGILLEKSVWKQGKENGRSLKYFPNGQLSSDFNRKNGKNEGSCVEWYESGIVKERSMWKEGKKTGLHEQFDVEGRLIHTCMWDTDRKDGEEKLYGPPHHLYLKMHAFWKKGKREGQYRNYYANGQLQKLSMWQNNQENGQFEVYFDTGMPQERATWRAGKREGVQEKYHGNGLLQEKLIWENNVKVGFEEKYDENGVLQEKSQ